MAPPFNPLAINLRRQTQHLASIVPPESPSILKLQSAANTQEYLDTLAGLLANPAYTQIIATLFRPILFGLCARWIENGSEDILVALCLLIEVHEELFPILSRVLQNCFPNGPFGFLSESTPPATIEASRLHRLLLAYFRILQANRQLPGHLQWPLAPLSQLIWAEGLDNATRLLAVKCYSIQAEMGEVESDKLEQQILGPLGGVDCPMDYGVGVDGAAKLVDGWLVEPTEIQRVRKERSELVSKPIDFYGRDEGDPETFLEVSDLSPWIENVEGVLLLKSSKMRGESPHYIPIPTSNIALKTLAHHISLRLPTLLTSTPSAGKALLLSHLATLLHPGTKNQIVTLHLADTSLDARALLGSYISSTTQSGSFEWKEGVLVRAMREGKWLVLEDVDRGSNEVLGTLKPLVESLRAGKWVGGRASIQVPGRGEVVAHEDFLIFATRSVAMSPAQKFPTATFFSAHKFYEIALMRPALDELDTIISGRFPRLAGTGTKAVIHMWDSLNTNINGKEFGLYDLVKFCRRLERLLPASYHAMDVDTEDLTLASIFTNLVLREDIYLEARDVFFGAGTMTTASQIITTATAKLIGEHLGLDADRCHWLTERRTPDFQIEADANGSTTGLRIARTYLPSRKAQSTPFTATSRPFAMHRPAVCLLSRIATAVAMEEPTLLIGETGTGKTSVITHLASVLRRPLISLNLSHQTESSDLIGGLKPVDARIPGSLLQERFSELFGATFSRKKNEKFESSIRKAVNEGKWKRVVGLWKESVRMAQERFQARKQEDAAPDLDRETGATLPRKRRKIQEGSSEERERRWATFLLDVEEFEIQHVLGKGKFTFAFVEGPLIKALRNGDWILLDEINLASPETLECISSLLHGPTASITLTENGELEPVPRHPDFRLFACMNPATDVGKKDLPPNIRSKFTEIDVPPPDADKETLLSIVEKYIGSHAIGDKGAIMNVAEFYLAVKDMAGKRLLADGSNHRPHFSMRTLARALTFAADIASTYSLRRAIWEGCLMAFTMVLDSQSAEIVMGLAHKHLLAGVRNPRSMLSREPNAPQDVDEYVKLGPFYLAKGPLPADSMEHYIMTPSVEQKLKDLARIILTRRFPVLIEGPTSSGKTSSIEYLAKRTGHEFIRINNHEHTDIQEYIGSYVTDPVTGKLVFKDGLLVQALRKGSWIVLDELNLAPTDVLEALNRLLDDNRELVIPETQEVVRPHPHFMLFATQNPPGLYAGRKILSRAFRNRFLEVHFEDVPQAELEVILCQRCRIAPSYGKKIVEVFRQLQKRRQSSRVFESKQGFVTLRDLFRWAGRDAVGYQELAENGYMLLAERTRKEEDKVAVKEVLEAVMNVRIDETTLYDPARYEADIVAFLGCAPPSTTNIIWTKAMQRLFVLFARALKFKEPVLLVGETGSGKTSVCQVYADAINRKLHGLSCHQNTETADIIGGLRPLRNRQALVAETCQEARTLLRQLGLLTAEEFEHEAVLRLLEKAIKSPELDPSNLPALEAARSKLLRAQSIFEWRDGPLIESMKAGELFLLDEISLAEDSVLERLNSVLEPERTIVLAERGGGGEDSPQIQADDNFRLVATMNPGGDYGKKELSPALRNRFTEIWVPQIDDRHDLELITNSLWKSKDLLMFTAPLLDFIEWLCSRIGDRSILTLRDILAWITFVNCLHTSSQSFLSPSEIFHHAANMTYLDGLSSLPQLSSYSKESIIGIKQEAATKLQALVPLDSVKSQPEDSASEGYIKLGPFSLRVGEHEPKPHLFTLSAPTTQDNALRLTRACQVPKPILLEGSPGVGKTSLVVALANITGQQLHRINLSDQTDLVDLFGSDLPVEGGRPGEFAWRDGEFLQALQLGHWVLLDEMNLAPQAVLEGLNAVLDHRGSVYIPELGRSFTCHPSFRIFAAQNPLNQGGGRKGLPKSFINRFTKVYIEELTANDYLLVCRHLFPAIEDEILQAMISFNTELNQEVVVKKSFARDGFPWEFNLRDVIRWGTLMAGQTERQAATYVNTIYFQRFRTAQDRSLAAAIAEASFSRFPTHTFAPALILTPSTFALGHLSLPRQNFSSTRKSGRVLQKHLASMESLGDCISQSWLAIIVGGRNSGKTEVVRAMAALTGNRLHEVSVNSATDTMDILGSFEQVDIRGQIAEILEEAALLFSDLLRTTEGSRMLSSAQTFIREMQLIQSVMNTGLQLRRLQNLLGHMTTTALDIAQDFAALHARTGRLLENENSVGRFEWIDGPLVRALKHGHWLLLDGANLCSPSVLDRLNSLCETDGRLVLSERGFVEGHVEVIAPHKNFKLFMTTDPHHGELSRAMRNRGIEITLTDDTTDLDHQTLQDYIRLPFGSTSSSSGPSPLDLAQFDGIRRGGTNRETTICSSKSASLGLVQCSSRLPALLNQLLSISLARSFPDKASVPFLIRSTVPNILPLIRRRDRQTEDTAVETTVVWDTIFQRLAEPDFQAGVKRIYSKRNSDVPSELLAAKPLDPYLYATGPLPGRKGSNISDQHSAILNYLDLIASRFMTRFDGGHVATVDQLSERHAAIVREINAVLASVHSVVEVVSKEYLDDPFAHCVNARKACLLLKCAIELQAVSHTVPFDFSRTLGIIKWLLKLLEDASFSFTGVSRSLAQLQNLVSLSRGLGLTEVWEAFYVETPGQLVSDLQRFSQLSRCLKDRSKVPAIRRQILDTMSLAFLQSHVDFASKYIELTTKLDAYLASSTDTSVIQEESATQRYDATTLALELSMLSKSDLTTSAQDLQKFIRVGCEDEGIPLSHIVPYQRLSWAVQDGAEDVKSLVLATINWLESTWLVNEIPGIPANVGPGLLQRPVHLLKTLQACETENTPLNQLAEYTTQLDLQLQRLYLECADQRTRPEMLRAFFLRSVDLVWSCFDDSAERDASRLGPNSSLEDRIQIMSQASNLWFKDLTLKSVKPLCNMAAPHASGLGWISLSKFLFELTVPNLPIDPATVRNSNYNRLFGERSGLQAQLDLHRHLEKLTSGSDDNEVIQHLETELGLVQAQLLRTPHLAEREDVSRLHQFWNEISQLLDMVLKPEKVDSLVRKLQSGESSGRQEEEVLQESLAGFSQRLDTLYHDFSDLVVISKLSIQYLRFGFRLLASSSSFESLGDPHDQILSASVAFPSVRSASKILERRKNLESLGANAFRGILLGSAGICTQVGAEDDPCEWIPILDDLYRQARGLWHIDRAKERDAVAASSTLYRKSNLDYSAMTDAEVEEQEFLELFPSFEDVLEEKGEQQHKRTQNTPFLVTEAQASMLCDIHFFLMLPRTAVRVAHNIFTDVRRETVHALLSSASPTPASLDQESLNFRLALLTERISSVSSQSSTFVDSRRPNFYLDSNVPEARKVVPILGRLLSQLEALQLEWPDQEVLRHLAELVRKVLTIDCHSPIAKILSAIEQLLLRTEDWEMYANRDNTLRAHRDALTTLIVEWRRLELSSWQALLDSETQHCRRSGSKWWFQLYDATIRGVLGAVAEEDEGQDGKVDAYLRDLVALLADFMSSSALGDFVYRLDLLTSFSVYATTMASTKQAQERAALQKVGVLLSSTHKYFAQFSSKLLERLASDRAVLEKDIKNFIKLASWKDINVIALKQSAQRSHHQLFKIVRRYREVLRKSISDQLLPNFVSNPQQVAPSASPVALVDKIDTTPLNPPPGLTTATVDYLKNLPRTFKKFEALVHTRIRPSLMGLSSDRAEALAVDIISSCHSLASISIPSTPGEKRTKFLKSVQAQKRKAWADLLKELKQAGFALHLKPDVLARNHSTLWIRQQAMLPEGDSSLLERVESYFVKLQSCLPTLRASAASHHDDISSRDLGKGVAAVEYIFNVGVELRDSLASSSSSVKDLVNVVNRLKQLDFAMSSIYERNLGGYLGQCSMFFRQLSSMISELHLAIQTFGERRPGGSLVDVAGEVYETCEQSRVIGERIQCLANAVKSSGFPALNPEECDVLERGAQLVARVKQDLQRWTEVHPDAYHLFMPSRDWLSDAFADLPPPPSVATPDIDESGIDSMGAIINTLLVTIQSASSICDAVSPTDPDDEGRYLSRIFEAVRRSNKSLNIATVHLQLLQMLNHIRHPASAIDCVQRILPFLDVYLRMVQDQLTVHAHWVKSLFKLDHVLCSVVQTIATQGFCKPPEDDGSEGKEAAESGSDGLGLGEGSGKENVSKEIEDESQVEGLQGEDQDDQPQDRGKDEKEDALEMTQDFGGDLEDVPDDGSEDEEDSGSDEGSDVDPEERMEDLDPLDPNAVDEKLWGDEEDNKPDEKDGNDKSNQDNAKTQDGKSEMVAKEGNDKDASKEKEAESENSDPTQEQGDDDNMEEQGEDQEQEDRSEPNTAGAPMDEHIPEGDVLDLPEDMDLGEDMEVNKDDAEMEDMGDEMGDMEEDEQPPGVEDDLQGDEDALDEDHPESKDGPPEDETSDMQDQQPDLTAETADEDKPDDSENAENELTGKADISNGDDGVDADDMGEGGAEESTPSGQQGASRRGGDRGVETEEKAANDQGSTDSQDTQDDTPKAEAETKGSAAKDGQQGDKNTETEFKETPNPLRSLGDALQEIQQRFDQIMDQEAEAPEQQVGDVDLKDDQLEYLRPDDQDVNMQALGPAEQHDVAKLNDLKLLDPSDETEQPEAPMDVDPLVSEGHAEHSTFEPPSLDQKTSRSQDADIEGAILQQGSKESAMSRFLENQDAPKAEADLEDLDHEVEAQLRNWRSRDYSSDGAERLWRLYESLTHDLAYALCEQLRLILEPTLATRLKGDYRTGKRLNMKKVISYIASDYTKDKIWLRRTKPSQREYQVLIAIDDSRSMAESHSIHLAYETLALLGKALNRLESGDISVVKFGENVEVVHGFDDGALTDQAGAKVIDAFRFNQKATNVLSLLETSLSVLDTARERRSAGSSSASDLWQLEIIISDGMCQDHEKLRTMLRRAEEKRIMVVFIILDSLHTAPKAGEDPSKADAGQRSILHMDKAEFKNVDGRMELQLQKYLDSFPFEYYVVLRDVEALPDVLSSTLKQFFERISEQ